ncbi:proline and serine-rich protein 3 isoform X2 [Anolis carolinensis]|uniref:proline and serine-rich protein 3 isoform X2 n=1 Tax=Anolis carolinensis TaxID=28377 RepID=UPI00046276C1|nr:PREDICTED: proline and serine-rich protein 3 isoform X2 [Anolis carolinensis]|eukprot:XP_008115287.1 PREDICTED: proline and serine-rich protein 3 isoform X2 [Anolis carolinensis]
MDSNLAIFSTLGSPFLESSSSLSHYHPSQTQPLKEEQRYTVLSPSRLQNKNCPTSSKKAETLSPVRLSFLPDISYQETKQSNSDSVSPFNESWPSTERSSSSLTPEGAKALLLEQMVGTKALSPLKLQEPISDNESVIARYIERFRYGKPTKRKERTASSDPSSQFWWFAGSSEDNIAKKESSPASDSSQSGVMSSLSSRELDLSPLQGDFQDTSTLDPETVNLQKRAAKLLQRSTSPSGNSRHVSSEGLGSTSPSTITNDVADLPEHSPPHLAAHQFKGNFAAVSCHLTQRSQSCPSKKPEEDLLFQWRLRRKMEEASKAAAVMPSVAWRSFSQPAPAASMVENVAVKLPESSSWKDKSREALPTSEAHTSMGSALNEYHFCSCTDPVRKETSFRQLRETTSFRNEFVETGSSGFIGEQGLKKLTPQETAVPAYMDLSSKTEPTPKQEQVVKEPTPQKDCVTTYQECSPPRRPSGTTKHLKQAISCHGQRTAESDEKVHSKPKGDRKPCRFKKGQAKLVTDFKEPPISPSKQSVQRVLGEVVAERLFSSPESPALHRDRPKRSLKDRGPKKTMPDNLARSSHLELLDMAAQLLEQAEDSDGTEFEDDPLLQVLRGQREVLRSQLRTVDTQMAQLGGQHSEQDFSG